MKTTYQVLSDIDAAGLLDDAVRKEIVPITSAFHKMVYENFVKFCHTMSKSQAVISAAAEAQMSERSVWYIIKRMET